MFRSDSLSFVEIVWVLDVIWSGCQWYEDQFNVFFSNMYVGEIKEILVFVILVGLTPH